MKPMKARTFVEVYVAAKDGCYYKFSYALVYDHDTPVIYHDAETAAPFVKIRFYTMGATP